MTISTTFDKFAEPEHDEQDRQDRHRRDHRDHRDEGAEASPRRSAGRRWRARSRARSALRFRVPARSRCRLAAVSVHSTYSPVRRSGSNASRRMVAAISPMRRQQLVVRIGRAPLRRCRRCRRSRSGRTGGAPAAMRVRRAPGDDVHDAAHDGRSCRRAGAGRAEPGCVTACRRRPSACRRVEAQLHVVLARRASCVGVTMPIASFDFTFSPRRLCSKQKVRTRSMILGRSAPVVKASASSGV